MHIVYIRKTVKTIKMIFFQGIFNLSLIVVQTITLDEIIIERVVATLKAFLYAWNGKATPFKIIDGEKSVKWFVLENLVALFILRIFFNCNVSSKYFKYPRTKFGHIIFLFYFNSTYLNLSKCESCSNVCFTGNIRYFHQGKQTQSVWLVYFPYKCRNLQFSFFL